MKLLLKKGFTLIELLVVIAIIGILVAVATANFLTAQKQARDTRRQQDMEAAQTAMETYYASNGVYPISTTAGQIESAFDSGIKPVDPQGADYSWKSDADSYCHCATMEITPGKGNANGSTVNGCTWTGTGQFFCVDNKQ